MEEGKAVPQSHVQELYGERPKPGFGAKLKAHFKKWWWLHLIVFIAVHATETATTHLEQEVQIVDLEAFTDYNARLWANSSVDLVVKGKTKLHEMKFPTVTVDFRKRIKMRGFEGIPGFNVTGFSIKRIPEPDGANMIGTVYIPNPTVLTLTMGNVTFNNFVDDEFIGTSLLSDLVLRPGNNTVTMRSRVNQTLVVEKVKETYKNGMLPIEIRSNSSIYNGQHLEYFEKALQGSRQHVVLNVGAALAALTGGGSAG
ncbi:MAG: hypothetical protein Q9196_003428 [Gyalolechia fulgens]